MSSSIQNLLVIFGLVVIAGLGYYLYSQNQSSSLSLNNNLVTNQASVESADFLRRLNALSRIQLDDSLFSDSRFRALENNTPILIDEPVGRPNPFLEVD